MFHFIQVADECILQWIADHLRIQGLDQIMILYTSLGNGGALFIVITILMLIWRKTRFAGIACGSGMLCGFMATNLILKPLVDRARPWTVLDNFDHLVDAGAHSFPSGHTCAAFAFAVALCCSIPRKWAKAAALIAAALMGFSRVYVGVHFPSDVLAGALIGALAGLAGNWTAKKAGKIISDRRGTV